MDIPLYQFLLIHSAMSTQVQLNSQIRLSRLAPPEYPSTSESVFQIKVVPPIPVDQVPKGSVVARNAYLSIDATMRVWLSGVKSYMNPLKPGDVMPGLGVAEIIYAPEGSKLKINDFVIGLTFWEKYSVLQEKSLTKLPGNYSKNENFLGVFGISGLTAYFGLKQVGKIKKGDVVVVSAAAGAVGELAVQIAKIEGCTVIGIAGGQQKCKYVKSLGADECIDYKKPKWTTALQEVLGKGGFDVYFDNVGGQTLDALLMHTKDLARVVLCGAISTYSSVKGSERYRLKNYARLIIKRATMQGFLYFDYAKQYPQAIQWLQQCVKEGRLKYRVDLRNGLEECPKALKDLLEGKNKGKVIVKVNHERKAKL